MEVKKSPKANLEDKKLLFTEIGLVITLVIVLAAFEWKTYEKKESTFKVEAAVEIEVENIPITTEAPPPPPEQPKIPVLSDQIDIVDDDIQVDDDLFLSLEDTKDMGVTITDYVENIVEEDIEEAPIPFALVEEKPSFMGGDANAFSKWVSEHLDYPEIAKENVFKKIILQFTVILTAYQYRVLRGVDSSLDKEAMRVVAS